jgi:hypothetical protein
MAIPDGVNLTKHHGQLKNNLVVDYVMWIRDRHPAAFDHRHPVLGPKLAAAQELRGTQFLVFSTRHNPSTSTQAESIHAMATTGSPASSTATATLSTATGTKSLSAVQAEALLSPAGIQVFRAPKSAILQSPNVALETLAPPSGGDLSTPKPLDVFHRVISSSSVVSTNFPLAQQSLEGSPAPIPEPSSLGLTLLLFASAACWKGWRARGGG